MKCGNCNMECVLRNSQTIEIGEKTYQTKREYKCPKCKEIYIITDNPVKIVIGNG